MKYFSVILLALATAASALSSTNTYASTREHAGREVSSPRQPAVHKRQLLTCEQTFGKGSVQCGNATTSLCYNPTQGQSCCKDGGYCNSGSSCAPVSGYCCPNGMDLASCAKSAGFSISSTPEPSSTSSPPSVSTNKPISGIAGNSTIVKVSQASLRMDPASIYVGAVLSLFAAVTLS